MARLAITRDLPLNPSGHLMFRAAYLDKRNTTFVVGRFERGGSIDNPRGKLHSADGEVAVDVATDAGERAREIHGHGPLIFHL